MNMTKFLNLNTAPTYNGQNHIAITTPNFYLPSGGFVPVDPQATFHCLEVVTITVIYALHIQFLLAVSVSPAHIPLHGAASTPLMFYL